MSFTTEDLARLKEAVGKAFTNTKDERKRFETSVSGPSCNKCGRDLWFCYCAAWNPIKDLPALLSRLAAAEELAYYCETDETIAERFSVKGLLAAWLKACGR